MSRTAIDVFSSTIGVSSSNFIEELERQRKGNGYDLVPIVINVADNGSMEHNAEIIGMGIDLMAARANEVIKNELDIGNVELVKKEFNEIYQWLKATRTSVTSSFDEVKSKFTANEKRLKDEIIKSIDDQILAMKEKTFKIAEANIRSVLNEMIDESEGIGITIDMFDSFIESKRQNASMLPTEKTKKTSAAALKTIRDEFEKIAKPIREALAINEKKDLQSKQFESYLDNIDVDSDNPEIINAAIKSLFRLRESVEANYPDVIESCHRSINNKIEKAEANIRALEAMAERDALQSKQNEIDAHDKEIMIEVRTINEGVLLDDADTLTKKVDRLRTIHGKLIGEDNKNEVVRIANSLKDLISKSNATDALQKVKNKTFGVSDDGIQKITFELQMMNVSAMDAADARAKIVAHFAEMFKTDDLEEL